MAELLRMSVAGVMRLVTDLTRCRFCQKMTVRRQVIGARFMELPEAFNPEIHCDGTCGPDANHQEKAQ